MAGLRLCVPISGRGSNLGALIAACADPQFPARIELVISNKASAAGLALAERAGIPTRVFDHRAYSKRSDFDREMTRVMEDMQIELICLAGFMRLLSDEFCDHWRDRMINIHPSLLPSFKGLDVQQAAIDAGVRFSGCTVHYVRKEMDTGPIVVQAAVPVRTADTAETLAQRILVEEHKIYPQAVRLIAEGQVHIRGERAILIDHKMPANALINPLPNG